MLGIILVMNMFGALAGCSWNSWIRNFVHYEVYGTLFPKKLAYSVASVAIVSLLASIAIEKIHFGSLPTTHYSVCFLIGTVFALIGIICIARIPEPYTETSTLNNKKFFHSLCAPIHDIRYRRLIYFMGVWNFAINMAAPFFVVYMMTYLDIGIFTIIVLSVVNQFATFLFYGIWGRLPDRFSNESCLAVSGFLFVISIAFWTTAEKHFLIIHLLLVIHVLVGISAAGITLCSNNIILKLAPKEEATPHLAACSMIVGLATAITPIIGAIAEVFFKRYEFTLTITCSHLENIFQLDLLDYWGLDFVFLIACITEAYTLGTLSNVKEPGEKLAKDVYSELMVEINHELKTMSTVMGLKFIFKSPKHNRKVPVQVLNR